MARTLEDIRASRPFVDRAKIEATTEEDIRRHAIEDGEDPDVVVGPYHRMAAPARVREAVGLSQPDFADALRIPLATLLDWEEGRVLPDPGSRSLLSAVARDAETVFRLIAGDVAA